MKRFFSVTLAQLQVFFWKVRVTLQMNWWHPSNFEHKRVFLEKRSGVLRLLRSFFEEQRFIEVETPALQICPVMDTHIHAFKTELLDIDHRLKQTMYLHTSPEFDMKKLLAAGMERIYQICHVYRNAEGSRLHSPEFTLLEWYRSVADYHALMDDCVDLFRYIARGMGIETYAHRGISCDPFDTWQRLSICEAFEQYAAITLIDYLDDIDSFRQAAYNINVRTIDTDAWDDIFHAIMSDKIEPNLGQGVPTILYDYPVSMAALSRKKDDDPRFAERFELYVCGIELANAFSELTDADEQRKRFEDEMLQKQKLYGETYPPDEEFFAALQDMPQSAGIALGVDRLVMLATGADDIGDVLWTSVQRL
tara:strand:- start:39793 stop:40887 length:1095 start_codon:yes stop_codon:yes gene_type:complete